MNGNSLVYECNLTYSRSCTVRLTASLSFADDESWNWTAQLNTGEVIASGKVYTRLAAQLAAQRAHESWLLHNGKRFSIPSRISYHWEEVA
jgi:hypothetical protein